MHLKFAPIDAQFIKEKVKQGYYSSETELVKDAVRHMREEDEKIRRFKAAIQAGDEQIDNGETASYNQEFIDNATKRAVKRAQKGDQPNPDVTA